MTDLIEHDMIHAALTPVALHFHRTCSLVTHLSLPGIDQSHSTVLTQTLLMDFHPKNIVITCILLASKAENYALNLGVFARKLAVKSNDRAVTEENRRTVLDLELLVSQSLQFEYAVTGAHRALYGLLLDLQSLPDNQAPAREELHKIAPAALSSKTHSSPCLVHVSYTCFVLV